MSIYDVFNGGSKPFDKAEWAAQKQAQRKEAYELIDNTCAEMMISGDRFHQYLDVQGRFDRYSVANAILVSAQMPEATQLKDYNTWKQSRVYTQLFQQLFYLADHKYGGSLPVHCHFIMDEFANVSLPDDFDKILSVMRSRGVSVSIILQNLAQLKALFEKQWESIVGNCDTFLYLGGNEQSTHKYVSELLGKETIDTNTYGKSEGRSGSYSTNYQISGRELMTPDEVRIFSTVLARLVDFGFTADKILIGKVDKVGIEQDNFGLCLCLFCAFSTNRNGLFIVGSQGYIIFFQWLFPRFQHLIFWFVVLFFGSKSADNQRASLLSRLEIGLAIPR